MSDPTNVTSPDWPPASALPGNTPDPGDPVDDPADVLRPGDLPPRLFLGDLDAASFRRSPHGWLARYRGAPPDTGLTVHFDQAAREFTAEWEYRGHCCHCSRGPAGSMRDVVRCSGRQLPGELVRCVAEELTRRFNVRVPRPPDRSMSYLFDPDGFLMAVLCIVPVARLADLPEVMADLARDPRIGAPISGHVGLGRSAVHYVDGLNEPLVSEPAAADLLAMEQTGLPTLRPGQRQTAPTGRAAVTVWREHYLLHVGAFLRDVEAVVERLAEHGLIGRSGDEEGLRHPTGFEYGGLVLPESMTRSVHRLDLPNEGGTRQVSVGRAPDRPELLARSSSPFDPERYRRFVEQATAATGRLFTRYALG